jgi:transposase
VAPHRLLERRWYGRRLAESAADKCGVRIEQMPWARTHSRFTHAFEAEVLRRARDCSISGVCRQLGLHWTSVMRLIERWVEESAARQFKKLLRVIGVDEVSYGRGKRKYLTIVWDHLRARVVWIGQGRERDTLSAFFAKLGTRRSRRIRVVTMDMWQGYIGVALHAPRQCSLQIGWQCVVNRAAMTGRSRAPEAPRDREQRCQLFGSRLPPMREGL